MRWLRSMWATPSKRWLCVRLLYLLFGLAWGIQFAVRSEDGTPFSLLLLFLILTLPPWFVVSTVGINKDNAAVRWRKPSWYRSSLSWKEPLQYLHDGALTMFAAGVGVLIGLPFGELSMWPHAVYLCAFGLAVWAGVWMSVRRYRENIEDP